MLDIKIKESWKITFLSVIIIGLIAHSYMFLNNFLSADSMWSLYVDQNMITSGRWFLTIACGISSYYQLPWVIGLLSMVWIGIAAVFFVEIFEVKNKESQILIAGIMVTFPALVSTYSYLYTADGYMLAVMLVCISIYLFKKIKLGFIPAGIILGFALGIYQAYLAFAILLCIGLLFISILKGEETRNIYLSIRNMIFYGVIGVAFYYIMLQILLRIQGLELSTYQGIDGMASFSLSALPGMLISAYIDFFGFGLRSGILANNFFSQVIIGILGLMAVYLFVRQGIKVNLFRKPGRILACAGLFVAIPLATNVILLISAEAYNHLVMRYHWLLFLLIPIVLYEHFPIEKNNKSKGKYKKSTIFFLTALLIANYILVANIAYFNMNERYEKTYAYCIRLADRMEETEGYYPGMPVMMIGVVDEEMHPDTDITSEVTDSMIGVNGSIFLYTGEQYEAFFSHYLSIPLNVVSEEEIIRIYETEEYKELDPFPSKNSMKVVDGILYIKTEAKE